MEVPLSSLNTLETNITLRYSLTRDPPTAMVGWLLFYQLLKPKSRLWNHFFRPLPNHIQGNDKDLKTFWNLIINIWAGVPSSILIFWRCFDSLLPQTKCHIFTSFTTALKLPQRSEMIDIWKGGRPKKNLNFAKFQHCRCLEWGDDDQTRTGRRPPCRLSVQPPHRQ